MAALAGPTSKQEEVPESGTVPTGDKAGTDYEPGFKSPRGTTYSRVPPVQDCIGLVSEYVFQYEALDKAERIWRRLAKTAGRSARAVARDPADWSDPVEACEQWRDQYEEAMTALVRHDWELEDDLSKAWTRFDTAQGRLSDAFEFLDLCNEGTDDPKPDEVISHLKDIQRYCGKTARASLGLRQVLISEVKTLVRELERMIHMQGNSDG